MSNGDKEHRRFELSLDGDHACAVWGVNLQEGEAEFVKIEGWPNATYKQEHAAMSAAYEALAAKIGVPVNRVSQIIAGKRAVTADTAWKLSKELGSTAEFWMNLQSAYDLTIAGAPR